MRVLREVLLLILLNITWITLVNATCQSTELVNGRNRCIVECGWGERVCECAVGYEECEFTMILQEIKTFTSYQVLGEKPNQILGTVANVYNLDDVTGEPISVIQGANCSDYTDSSENFCIEPNWVDGKNYKVLPLLNGVLPGPTIIVDEGSTVIAHINNQLISDATSIHWHGLLQINTPWMDGVGEITQCPIEPATTFTHAFITTVPGTYWYHSHTGTQRADGLFGGLVVRENGDSTTQAETAFASFGIGTFLDYPDRHTIVVSDWFEGTSINDFVEFDGGLGFHPSIPIQDVPTRNDPTYEETQYYDGGGGSPIPYYSLLINGLGKEETVPYNASRLSEFRVQQGNVYRFRLIGGQSTILLRFSIDGHNLTTIATDSYFIEPIEDVHYIILHSGERYDFLLNANADISNYIMRLETMEADANCSNDAPFASLNHYTEAILHYETAPFDNGIPSTAYESISQSSPQRDCTVGPRCRAVNCPFEKFHTSYGIDCINVASFRLLIDTPPSELPQAYASDPSQLFFLNFNFEGPNSAASINGRSFVLPPYPPQTNDVQFNLYSDVCNNAGDCSTHPSDQFSCICTHVLTFDYNKTVQIVVSAIGRFRSAHPLHIHGHTYHVVKIGYPTYYENNGYAEDPNTDIDCGQTDNLTENLEQTNQIRQCGVNSFSCTNPSWSQPSPILSINSKTPRKDVVIVPTGGYVVVNLISDNPGWWFAHCHIEPHQLNGMALVINEAPEKQNPAPEELVRCENYIFNSEEFYNLVNFNPNQAGIIQVSILLLVLSMLAFLIVF